MHCPSLLLAVLLVWVSAVAGSPPERASARNAFPDLSERCGNNCVGFCGEPSSVYFDLGFMLIYQTSLSYHSVYAL
jgi:hypothetical protein